MQREQLDELQKGKTQLFRGGGKLVYFPKGGVFL